jgi:hypothetical protein
MLWQVSRSRSLYGAWHLSPRHTVELINIAKLPSVPRTILKGIPRPLHSAQATMIEACGRATYAQATALGLCPRRSAVSESRDVTEGEPTDDDLQNTAAHWRARAEETRKKANAMGSPELKERMLKSP